MLVDFREGPQMIQGCWVTQDRKYSAWPPEADKLDPLEYDKYLQSGVHEPQPDWVLHPIRIRAYSGENFYLSVMLFFPGGFYLFIFKLYYFCLFEQMTFQK